MRDGLERLGSPARKRAIEEFFRTLAGSRQGDTTFIASLRRQFAENGDLSPLQFEKLQEAAQAADRSRSVEPPGATARTSQTGAAELFRRIAWSRLQGSLRADMLSIKARFDSSGTLTPAQIDYVASVARQYPRDRPA